jgi:hypothetical protein
VRQDYGEEKADEVTRQILTNLPENASLEDAEKYAAEYRVAHHETVEHGEHPTLGDIVRGLFLLPEATPEERLHRKHLREQARKRRQRGAASPKASP